MESFEWRGENKRVRSSSGRSQDCVRLGTSQDKSCFNLLELRFLTSTVFWERKLRAQGFLHKEMRICAVVGCSSSTYQLQKWRKGFCTSHNCHRTSQDCTCPDLFQLYPFPTLKGDPEKRKEWVKSINRKNPKTGKNWQPSEDDRKSKWWAIAPVYPRRSEHPQPC